MKHEIKSNPFGKIQDINPIRQPLILKKNLANYKFIFKILYVIQLKYSIMLVGNNLILLVYYTL